MSSNTKPLLLNQEQEIANAIWLNLYGLIFAGGGWYVLSSNFSSARLPINAHALDRVERER